MYIGTSSQKIPKLLKTQNTNITYNSNKTDFNRIKSKTTNYSRFKWCTVYTIEYKKRQFMLLKSVDT